ncbi:RsmB/NOP family class I SAM-dependent RNA methyltransferase [Jannaschia sp. W003]|uniref:RsmB/NOP family class I SAM-dependent RNA methyltransferase n=1 Tax=Jannaschia sp. W003 TaxID=2867012 RepID=UPI0021A355B7|nr:RsmB/NOP family class I SAM-dependent RNA methyltransferase [Jannaschia sp. W003]UWQ20322.1 RsmB/NOP family class I SAM-dependent RNA methyltransferase [Jannaschia sp. W003]
MTPAARLQAAIEVLDAVLPGGPAERELTAWGRRSRFAGSKDRAAVRDHVFDALRRLRSSAWLGGLGDVPPEAMTGRAVIAGLLRGQGTDPAPLFDGSRYGPAPLEDAPLPPPLEDAPEGVRFDVPDWLLPDLHASLGDRIEPVCEALRHRAPIHLRANLARTSRDDLVAALAETGFDVRPHPLSPSAVEVAAPARGLAASDAFAAGLFEMQDAASQAVVDRLPLEPGMRVLDLCAGGGGKALAMAARMPLSLTAHDAAPERMRDLPARAGRAGAEVTITERPEDDSPFDLVLCDVPCSGSGAWRRQPEARWRLTSDRLAELKATQTAILARAAALVRPGGHVALVTCSVLDGERWGAAEGLRERSRWASLPDDGADGLSLQLLARS